MDTKRFDVGIVGTGTSAYYCAHKLAKAGKRLAIVDERGYGGTCALRGCQPKKYLVANAEAIANAHHLLGKGIAVAAESDWQALQALKNDFTSSVPAESEKGFRDAARSCPALEIAQGYHEFIYSKLFQN
jgi:glutathione reductase (NADPH)